MAGAPELVAATNFSFLRGASHPDEMVLQAKAYGLSAIGVCDRNTLAGVVRAHAAGADAGQRVLIGARIVAEGGLEAAWLPKTRAAYGRLCRLITQGARRGSGATDCLLTLEDACDPAFAGERVLVLLPPRRPDAAWRAQAEALRMAATPDDAVAVGLRRWFDGRDGARAHELAGLAAALAAPLAAVGDVLFHDPARRMLADVVACVREGVTIDAAGDHVCENAERVLLAPHEIQRRFADHPEAVAHAGALADTIAFSLDEIAYQYPDETGGARAIEVLRARVAAGVDVRYPRGAPQTVRAALARELDLIERLDYASYFLTVEDLARFARARGIACQGRGSAANSVVCFCLGVTAVDPGKVDLLFERFISEERREPPDIDIDFEHARREEVIQYIYEKYGRARAGLAATVITYRARSAVRDVAKALGLSRDVADALAKTVWGWSAEGVDPARARDELGLDVEAPRLKAALDLARALAGFPRHLSQHVGGFVITRDRLDEVVPVRNATMDGRTLVEWDKDDLDRLGILKIDVLALGMLTCLSRAFELLAERYDRPMGLADTPQEDPRVYDMICAGDTVGVFQIESRAQMSMLPRLKPRTFYDLVIEVAIVRPGPIQGDMVHPYLRRREGREAVSFPSAELESVLGKTLGVPLFQEQAMRIAIVAAGFSPAEADRLRRAMATFRKVGIIHEFGLRLVDGMVANGYERDFAERCFKQIEGFGEYGFPESHAASFAILVYVSCWLKRHYPDVFLAAMLNAQPLGFYAPAQLVRDARAHGVVVRAPDVNASDWEAVLEAGPGVAGEPAPEPDRAAYEEGGCAYAVRLGLRQIKGLSEAAAAKIVAARQVGGPFDSPEAVMRRARVGRETLTRLAEADAFRSVGRDRRTALWAAKALAAPPPPLFAALDASHAAEAGAEALPTMPLSEHVAQDYAALALSLKAHPIAFFRDGFTDCGITPAADLARIKTGAACAVAGLVLVRQRPGSAKGVIFATLEDETGTVNVIVWPKVFERFRKIVLGARVLEARGRVQREGRVIHLVADHLADLSHRLAELSAAGVDPGDPFARADEVKNPSEDPRLGMLARKDLAARRAAAILPASRDFH